jgi:hypothetical protein
MFSSLPRRGDVAEKLIPWICSPRLLLLFG